MTWREHRVAEMADLVNGFPFDSSEFSSDAEVPLIRIRDILNEPFETYVPAGSVPDAAVVRDGDVVIGMDGDFNVVHWSRGAAALNQRLCLLRHNGAADTRFLAYALPAHLKAINDLTYATTVKHLSSGQVRSIRLFVPELQEQRDIASYLDRETARIDTLIEEQRRLIELLEGRRAAVIAEATTKGLSSETPRVATGVDWIGEVPAGWRVVALRRFGTLITGSTPQTSDQSNFSDEPNEFPWVRPQDLSSDTRASAWLTSQGWQQVRAVPAGAVLVGCIAYSLGSVGHVAVSATTNQQITGIVPAEDPRFLYYVMRAARDELWASAQMNRVPILNNERLGAIRVPAPPLGEQRQIAAYLDQQMTVIDAAKLEASRLVELLQERRAALITAAVTGQIDVRDEVVQ